MAIGFAAHQTRGPAVPMLARTCGFDWVFVDLEHGATGFESAIQTCTACQALGIPSIVRLSERSMHEAGRLLDHGAMGVIAPHVDTAEQASAIVEMCKFPPEGTRSWIGPGAAFHYGSVPQRVAQPILNAEILVCVQIETPESVENADEIASVPGVDVLMIGTLDLSAALGVPGDISSAPIRNAFHKVGQACAMHGKVLGMGGVYDETCTREYIDCGVRFLLGGSDLLFLTSAATSRARFLRQIDPWPAEHSQA